MGNTIDMQHMRYINLFEKITNVNTSHCFKYNRTIIFAIPKKRIPKAIGERGINVKKLSEILDKRIRFVVNPEGVENAREFIEGVVNPTSFKDLEIKGEEMIITAGMQNKAALIGINRRRFFELQQIVKDYFGKELRII